MSEMRWVLLGGAAIVMAMLVAWTMQSDTGPMPSSRGSHPSPAIGATPINAAASSTEGAPKPMPRTVGGPVNLRATYGNPLAAQLNHDKMVKVEPQKEEPAAAPEGK
jgi:hypothetical protein